MPPATKSTTQALGLRADARRNRTRVLEAARGVFSRDGLDAQMDDVARAAGVGVGTVYRHFPHKEDLLQALADARFESIAEAAREALDAEDPWQGFVDLMTHAAELMSSDRGLSEAMDQRAGSCRAAAERAGLDEVAAAVVERAKAAGALRADIDGDDLPSLICGLGRATHRCEKGPPPMSWQRYLEIMLAGLRNPGQP